MLPEGRVRAPVGGGGEQGLVTGGVAGGKPGGGGAGRVYVHSHQGPVWLEWKHCSMKGGW